MKSSWTPEAIHDILECSGRDKPYEYLAEKITAELSEKQDIIKSYETAINKLPPDILVHWTHVKFGDINCNCKKELIEQFKK